MPQPTRLLSVAAIGALIALTIGGCATETESPTPAPVEAKKPEQDNFLRDWADGLEATQDQRGPEEGGTAPQTPTVAELEAALGVVSGHVLVEAAGKGDLKQVEQEITRGTDLNARDKTGNTALMAAAAKGHVDVVRKLLEAGADASLTNKAGKSAAQLAQAAGFQEIRALCADAAASSQ